MTLVDHRPDSKKRLTKVDRGSLLWDNQHTMNDSTQPAPISDLLRRTISEAVEAGRTNYKALERETGVTRASIMRFARGTQSLHLGMADKLAAHFGLELRPKRKGR